MALQQILADQETQHGVAQELQLLVIARGGLSTCERPFMDVRTMRQRAAQDLPVGKAVTGGDLQSVQIRAHKGYGFGVVGFGGVGFAGGAASPGLGGFFFWNVRTRSACATCLTVTLTSGMAITLSNCAMASSYFPSSA